MKIILKQYKKDLDETMYISRGGFEVRTHNFIELEWKGKTLVSEVIGDSGLIKYLLKRLSSDIKVNSFFNINDLIDAVDKWYKRFVYLESESSARSILCAFDWLHIQWLGLETGKSIYKLIGIEEPKNNFVRVYGSNIYWKDSVQSFNSQIESFDFSNTRILKAHLGRLNVEEEINYYDMMLRNNDLEKIMIDLNCGYSLEQLAELDAALSDYDNCNEKILWLEEPTIPEESKFWNDYTNFPLAAGENHHGLRRLIDLSSQKIKWIMPDIGRTMKVSDFGQLLAKISQSNSLISFHSYSSGFLAYMTMDLTIGMNSGQTLYEHDFSNNPLMEEIHKGSIWFKDGYAYIDLNAMYDLKLPKSAEEWTIDSMEVI